MYINIIVFYCTSCIAFLFFLSFTYTVYLSVCMSPVYVYAPCCLI